MKPTQEQVEKFWRWCGFEDKWEDTRRLYLVQWQYPDGQKRAKLPTLNLNSFFKWAVPKLAMYEVNSYNQGDCHDAWVALDSDGKTWTAACDKDPALALFWAIYKVMEGQ